LSEVHLCMISDERNRFCTYGNVAESAFYKDTVEKK